VKRPSYLAAIRQLPCVSCGRDPAGEAAHLRLGELGRKDWTAKGRKPDDKWTTPLCGLCHRDGPNAQHKMAEAVFWNRLRLDPIKLCEDLFSARDHEARLEVIRRARVGWQ